MPLCVIGAVPPWLQDDPLEGTSGAAAHPEIGPSLQEFLKQSRNHTQEKWRYVHLLSAKQFFFAQRFVPALLIISMRAVQLCFIVCCNITCGIQGSVTATNSNYYILVLLLYLFLEIMELRLYHHIGP